MVIQTWLRLHVHRGIDLGGDRAMINTPGRDHCRTNPRRENRPLVHQRGDALGSPSRPWWGEQKSPSCLLTLFSSDTRRLHAMQGEPVQTNFYIS